LLGTTSGYNEFAPTKVLYQRVTALVRVSARFSKQIMKLLDERYIYRSTSTLNLRIIWWQILQSSLIHSFHNLSTRH